MKSTFKTNQKNNVLLTGFKNILTLVIFSFIIVSCSKPDDGAAGPTGTANVIYSNWAMTNFTQPGSSTWISSINAPQISQDIVDKGTVLVYMKDMSTTPNTIIPINFSAGSVFIVFGYEIGKIRMSASNDYSVYPFRYIIIPGGVSISGKSMPSDYKKMSYSEVCKSLNISE